MGKEAARVWLVKASLAVTTLTFAFFILAPAFKFPLSFGEAVRLLEIITPVFLGYLGSATQFIFWKEKDKPTEIRTRRHSAKLLNLLVKGPVFAFSVAVLAAIVAFWYSNRSEGSNLSGMTVDGLAGWLSAALGILTVSTSAIVAGLFGGSEKEVVAKEAA